MRAVYLKTVEFRIRKNLIFRILLEIRFSLSFCFAEFSRRVYLMEFRRYLLLFSLYILLVYFLRRNIDVEIIRASVQIPR